MFSLENTADSTYPTLLLGSAMWGWTTPPAVAFQLLDSFYAAGFRQIDTATNYPINKQPEDFRRAENILLEWIKAHQITDLQVIVKIGSLNNLRSSEHNLTHSFLLLNSDDYSFRFGRNLAMLMVHWDNRDQLADIQQTFEGFQTIQAQGIDLGLSGIRHPTLYAELNQVYQFDFKIQIKHNIFHSDYEHYAPFHGKRRFLTYGINAGGIKLQASAYHADSSLRARGGDTSEPHALTAALQQLLFEANQQTSRPPLDSMNHIGMLYAYHSPDIQGIIIGPSSTAQLQETLLFYRQMQQFDYVDVIKKLKSIHLDHRR